MSCALAVFCCITLTAGQAVRADEQDGKSKAKPVASTEATGVTADSAGAEKPAADSPAPGSGKKWIRGSFDAGFDGVWARRESDLYLNQTLRLEVDPPQCDRLHLRGCLWMNENLDSSEPAYSALRSINDASGSDVRTRLLYLYAEYDNLWGDSVLRVGRQRIMEGVAFNRIDGVYFKQHYGPWDWYVFGGARASFYEDASQDLVGGAGVALQACSKTRLALDAYLGEDHRGKSEEVDQGLLTQWLGLSYPRRVARNINDQSVALSIWQTITPNLSLFGRYNYLSGNGNEGELHLTGFVEIWDFTYELSWRGMFTSVGDRVPDLPGYYRVLGVYEKYNDFLAVLHKPISKKFMISLEAELRDSEAGRNLASNRDYQRYAAILSGSELYKGLGASVSLEDWVCTEGEHTWAVTGEVTKRLGCVLLTLGSDYQRYQDRYMVYNAPLQFADLFRKAVVPGSFQGFDPLLFLVGRIEVVEHQNVHSVYLKTKWKVNESQDANIRITYENDDAPESPYWRVQTDYSVRF